MGFQLLVSIAMFIQPPNSDISCEKEMHSEPLVSFKERC